MNRVFTLLVCCRPLLPRRCLRLRREPGGVCAGERAEQRGHRHARVSPGRRPHRARAAAPRAPRSTASRRASPPRSTRRSRARRSAGGTGSCSTAPPSSSRTARSAACRRSRASGRSTPERHTRSARPTRSRVAKAAATWSTGLTNQGAGIKIAIIDDGVDQTPPVLRSGRVHDARRLPEGPDRLHDGQGDRRSRVRAGRDHVEVRAQGLRPRPVRARNPRRRDRRRERGHPATGGVKVSGIAPRAYIGNYKALSVPTDANVGLDGNAPEIVAAIEAAVSDGMDVINLSLGEPEVEPSRDIVARALDAAAAAGVVPVVAAGNDFEEYGGGSSSRPAPPSGRSPLPPSRAPRRGRARARRLQLRRPDTAVAAAEARRQRPRRLDPVLRARRPLGGDVRHVDGDATDRRRSGPPARAASRTGRWPSSRRR